MGKMPMPRQATTGSFPSSSLRLYAFALICSSLLASSASAGYPPETEALPAVGFSLDFEGWKWEGAMAHFLPGDFDM